MDADLAVEVLRAIAADKAAPESSRVTAARALLERGVDVQADRATPYDDLTNAELADVLRGLDGLPPACPPDPEPSEGQG